MEATERHLRVVRLGVVEYAEAVALQRQVRSAVSAEDWDALLLLEHPHVYTLGRNAQSRDVLANEAWLAQRGVTVVETDRGGQVTYHGPGQLVGYPILDLSEGRRDLRRYVRALLECVVQAAAALGLEAKARHAAEELGVWVADRKLASVGVHLSRWRTTHGFALNVETDLSYFDAIVPCGLTGVQVTSLAEELGRPVGLDAAADAVTQSFANVFGYRRSKVESQDASCLVESSSV